MKHTIITSFFFLLLNTHVSSLFRNLDPGKCSNRYEFRKQLPKMFPELKNCSYVRQEFPMCAQDLVVSFSEHPPYITMNRTAGLPQGLLPGMLRLAMSTCCYGCTKVKFVGPFTTTEKYFVNASIAMPIESAKSSKRNTGYFYVPFLDVPGVTILAKPPEGRTVELSKHLALSVLATWPLFIIAFMMAAIAGCVVWVLDTWFNKDEFPSSFPRGPFEGFWWAFVSMTTVGYGDRAPKSIIARLFAVLWILLGITIFSLYTATLTSALTNNLAIYSSDSVYGRNIGSLSSTAAGISAVVQKNAHSGNRYDTVEEMVEALRTDKLYGVALDDNLVNYHYIRIKEKIPNIRLHSHFPIKYNSYGILVFNETISEFIRSFFESNEDNKITMMSIVLNEHWPHIKKQKADPVKTESIFSPKSPIFIGTVITLIITGLVTIAVGLTCKWFFKTHDDALRKCIRCQEGKKKKKKDMEMEAMVPNGGNKLQEEFSRELDELKSRWLRKFQQSNGNEC